MAWRKWAKNKFTFFNKMALVTKSIQLQSLEMVIATVKMEQVEVLTTKWMESLVCSQECLGSLSTCYKLHYALHRDTLFKELVHASHFESFHSNGYLANLMTLALENNWACYPMLHRALSHVGKYLWPNKWHQELLEQDPFCKK